jgi:hypothetical protein
MLKKNGKELPNSLFTVNSNFRSGLGQRMSRGMAKPQRSDIRLHGAL